MTYQKGSVAIALLVGLVVILGGALGYTVLMQQAAKSDAIVPAHDDLDIFKPKSKQKNVEITPAKNSNVPTNGNGTPASPSDVLSEVPLPRWITIMGPTTNTRFGYEGFDLKWDIAPDATPQVKNVSIYAWSDYSFCYNTEGYVSKDPANDSHCGTNLLLAKLPADVKTYHVKINPGCLFEMPVYIRVTDENERTSDIIGPIILEGGACGPSYE